MSRYEMLSKCKLMNITFKVSHYFVGATFSNVLSLHIFTPSLLTLFSSLENHPSSPPPLKINQFVHVYGWYKLQINLDKRSHPNRKKSRGWLIKNLLPGDVSNAQTVTISKKKNTGKTQGKRKMQEELGREEKGNVSKMKSRNISWVSIFLWA